MKKCGIITYFGENYGACLQAYAVQEIMENYGFDSEIINYLPSFETSKVQIYFRKVKYLANINKYLKEKKIMIKYSTQRLNRSKKFREFIDEYLKITEKKYSGLSDLKQANFDYDIYITGSDQLWNPFHHKCNPIYFLDFVCNNKRRIAFAPSIAISEIPNKYKKEMTRLLNNIDYISVREDINVKTVNNLVPLKEISHVLDPTLMLTKEDWDKIISEPIYTEPYIFCYLFGTLDYIGEFVKYVKDKTGIKVVSVPYNVRELKNGDTQNLFNVGPLDFVNLIKNSSLVITDSFHATAFSINYQKSFYTLLRQNTNNPNNMNSRFFSILKLVGLEERLIMPESDFSTMKIENIDYEKPMKKLDIARKKTRDYLERSFE